jgi:hypothetical protein
MRWWNVAYEQWSNEIMKNICLILRKWFIMFFTSRFFIILTFYWAVQSDLDQIIYTSSASNDFDKIFFHELLRIFNVLRARKDENENVFSKRDDHDVYFWIILNKFNLFKWKWFNQIKVIEWEWLNEND